MKKSLLILIILAFSLALFPEGNGTFIDLNIDAKWYDAKSDNNGTIHLIWITEGKQVYYGQISGDAVVNQEHISIARNVTTKKYRPRIAVRPDGSTVHFCWRSPSGNSKEAIHCWRDENGVWNKEVVYTTRGSYIAYPSIAVDSTGMVHFICSKWNKGSNVVIIVYGRKVNGNWILYNETLGLETENNGHTNMFSDSNGGIHAIWSVSSTTLQYLYCPSGGSLLDSPTIDIPTNGLRAEHADVYVDREDNIHVTSLSFGQPATRSYADYTIKLAGEPGFSVPIHASIDSFDCAFSYISFPVLCAGSKDLVYVAWAVEENEGRVNLVRLSTFRDGEWTSQTLAPLATIDEFGKPAIVLSNSSMYVIWRNREGKLSMYKELTGLGVTITVSPLNGNKVCGTTTIKVESPVSGDISISQIELFINGSSVTTSSNASFEYEWDASSIPAGGSAVIKAVATYTNSETSENEVTVVRDCPPTVIITEPLDNSSVFSETTIRTNITDDIGVDRAEFFVDNTLKHTTSVPPYTYTWDPEEVGIEKNYNLLVKAYDTGSQSGRDEVTVSYRKIFPPLNAVGVKKINRTLFFFEYANVLTWEANPQNTSHSIAHYRIYQTENGTKTLLGEVDGNTFTYAHRDVEKDSTYTYAIASVTAAGVEGGYALVEVN